MKTKPKLLIALLCVCFTSALLAQKKPLDHTVYDGWQSIGEKLVSNNGRYVVYTVVPQEGDGTLYIQLAEGGKLQEIARGYAGKITSDNGYVICKIKPLYKDTREARIKKKKPEEMPKDSLAIYNLSNGTLTKIPAIKSFKVPEEGSGWVAYLLEKKTVTDKPALDSATHIARLQRAADSLARMADSLRNQLAAVKKLGFTALLPQATAGKPGAKKEDSNTEEGTDLVLRSLATGEEVSYALTSDYLFDKKGDALIVRTTRKNNDSLIKAYVLWLHLHNNTTDTVMRGLNDARSFALDEEATRLAFVAERDSSAKAIQKYYKLWYYMPGNDSAQLLADRFTKGVPAQWTISENADLYFGKTGKKLFLGTAPILPPKDTTLPEFERAAVDIWNYKDEVLQTVQLFNLNKELKRSFVASWDETNRQVIQLADTVFRAVQITGEGDGSVFYTATDTGKRVASQWQGYTFSDVYAIDAATGRRKLVVANFKGSISASYTGKYLLLYNESKRNYSIYNATTGSLYPVAADAKVPFYDEENDVPDDPNAYGIARWMQDDKYVLIYDRYDIWKIDPEAKEKSVALTQGRASRLQFRYTNTNENEKFLIPGQQVLLRLFNEADKSSGLAVLSLQDSAAPTILWQRPVALGAATPVSPFPIQKAKDADVLLYTQESFTASPNLYTRSIYFDNEKQLSTTNPQQAQYLWGTASLYKWKAYTGKLTEGILYKPENFDAKKKYPMIVYFYERNNNTLYNYVAPAPTPSRLNVSFFVSRGYVVFVPDIWYTTGHPGRNAYDYIVSGTRALVKEGFIDSTRMALQGQSWGGYQTVAVITQTSLYKAAWAGAPVVNMFSAYGGIRWESGLNRQFQYEHTQSRIGATIWDKPALYTENSPLFQFPKVKTPLVIMANDADGAVPWYQGIECFTALRRLNKPVWMLNYNGEAHNLMERRNRKDIQIREQQFFDWMLKGEKPAPWLAEGVPAIMKGRTWGL